MGTAIQKKATADAGPDVARDLVRAADRISKGLRRIRKAQRDVLKLERRMRRNDSEQYEALEPDWIRLTHLLGGAQHELQDTIVALRPEPPTPPRPDLEGFRGGFGDSFVVTHDVPWNLVRSGGDFYVVMDDDLDYQACVKVLAIDGRAFIDLDAMEKPVGNDGVLAAREGGGR